MSEALSSPAGAAVSLDSVLGFEILEVGSDSASAQVAVGDRHKQPYGLVHGGVYAAMAESLASVATATAVFDDGKVAMGMSNLTSFMRPVTSGTLHARARRLHSGSTTWIWDVEMSDDDGRQCAVSRVTVAVRPRPSGRSPGSGS